MAQNGLQTSVSKKSFWAGRIVSWLLALFLLLDGAIKLAKPAFVVEANVKLGFSESVIAPLGIVLITCTILYLIPITSVLGAILLTGYLGNTCAGGRRDIPDFFRHHPWRVALVRTLFTRHAFACTDSFAK